MPSATAPRRSIPQTLLLDVGNTHTHIALASPERITRHIDIPTANWSNGQASTSIQRWLRSSHPSSVAWCSVVPNATPLIRQWALDSFQLQGIELNHTNLVGVGVSYPKPKTIGADRLANAVAVAHHFGAPSLVVDFGTAVTFDVVDRHKNYVGGIITPGLSAMTDYLHEKTALLPRIQIREPRQVIGKSTRAAMLVGAVHGYRGLIRELIREIKAELNAKTLPVVATGGYAQLMAARLPEITAVDPLLTLEGLRLVAAAATPSIPPHR